MAEEPLGPDYLTARGIPTSRRGYDKRVVDAVLAEARAHWQELLDRYEELRATVEETGGMDFLGKELSAIGDEVGEVLQAAQQAAEGIRSRSREDSERLEREAAEAAEAMVSEAEQQAFDLRRDAWEQGMELLESIEDERDKFVQSAKDDALLIRAQAEKDAHRHIASAEREVNDLIRQARYEADRQLNQAREVAQQIIDRAATPQYLEPTDTVHVVDPAAESQRDELLGEIDRIQLEQSIDSVRVFENEPSLPDESPDGIDLSDLVAADVEELNSEPIAPAQPEPVAPAPPERPRAAPKPAPPSPEPEVVTISTTPPAQQFGTEDDVGTLFEALRTTGEVDVPVEEDQLPADPFELREQLLIPIVNEGVRTTKRRIVDFQNGALAGLRANGWQPDPPAVGRELAHALEAMILKSASAGATAAGPLAGLRGAVAEPGERASQLVSSMAASLSGHLAAALEGASGPEEAAEAASRVFRTWRTDDGDQWVRMIATTAYHDSLIAALRHGGVLQIRAEIGEGSACDSCPGPGGKTWRPGREPPDGTKVPPATLGCGCAVVVSG